MSPDAVRSDTEQVRARLPAAQTHNSSSAYKVRVFGSVGPFSMFTKRKNESNRCTLVLYSAHFIVPVHVGKLTFLSVLQMVQEHLFLIDPTEPEVLKAFAKSVFIADSSLVSSTLKKSKRPVALGTIY